LFFVFQQSNDLLQHLPTAAFIAIDEEMTGISVNGRPSKDDTPEQRYLKHKQVPEKYSIVQVGIALFHQHPEYPAGPQEFLVRRYNFYLFPSSNEETSREVTLNPSSIQFLNQHCMDFNMWTREGIPYVTTTMASPIIQKYKDHRLKHESKESITVRDPTKRRVELSKTEDVNFHARAMASLREWIDSVGTTTFLLPACNGFLRRALYESIELEYPALICESAGPAHKDQIRVWRLSPEEKREREELLQKEAWERMVMQVGFWRVFTAISNACRGLVEKNSIALAKNVNHVSSDAEPEWESIGRKIPVVVHNGLMDLLFLMTHFHSHQLPDSYLEAKALLVDYFPMVYDTKVLSTEYLEQSNFGDNTVLGNLYTKFVKNDELFDLPNQFQIVDAVGDNSTTSSDQLHEAGYDAFMTGAVFVALSKRIVIHNDYAGGDGTHAGVAGLSHLLSNDADAKKFFGRNKVREMNRKECIALPCFFVLPKILTHYHVLLFLFQ
jgi:poly(A)-specific ribonuclease